MHREGQKHIVAVSHHNLLKLGYVAKERTSPAVNLKADDYFISGRIIRKNIYTKSEEYGSSYRFTVLQMLQMRTPNRDTNDPFASSPRLSCCRPSARNIRPEPDKALHPQDANGVLALRV